MQKILEKQSSTLERIEDVLIESTLVQLSQAVLSEKMSEDTSIIRAEESELNKKVELSNNYLMRMRSLTESILYSVRGQFINTEKLLEHAELQSSTKTAEQNLEAERDRTAMVKALEKIADNTTAKPSAQEKGSSLGAWGTILAVALGGIVGAITGYVQTLIKLNKVFLKAVESTIVTIGKFFPSIKKMLFAIESTFVIGVTAIKSAIQNVFGKATEKFASIVDVIDDVIRRVMRSSVIRTVIEVFNKITNAIKTFFQPMQEAFKMIQSASAPVANAVNKIKTAFGAVVNFFTGVQKATGLLATIARGAFNLGKFLGGPLVRVVLTTFETINGAIEGFKKEGWLGAISGAIKGFIEGFATGFLDLGKDIISWVLDAMGFEKASAFLDSFSFTDIMKGFVDAIFHPIDTIKRIFESAIDLLSKIEIPEMSFTIPVINKKVSIGPFKPFKNQSESSSTSTNTNTISSSSTSTSSNTVSAEQIKKETYNRTYQEAIIAGKTPQEATMIASAPAPRDATAVYKKSADNQQAAMNNQSAQQSVIVSAPTNVSNNSNQNIAMPAPIRNDDSGFNRYVSRNTKYV